LGRNLILRVKDVVQSLEKVACLNPKDTMRHVVSEMTKYPLGAACVIENGNLHGIITEGDLRRALNNSCELDSTRAEEIMTCQPQQIFQDDTLGKALEIMERGASKISILPVLERKSANLIGLLRLHDIFS
jgi:arabinose-5-phosphate isomerase